MPLLAILKNRHAGILFSFGAIQAMQLALPLLAFPWLGRILGPEYFGLLMYMCVLPPIVTLFMDWGLPLGGARLAARARTDPGALRELLEAVTCGRGIMASFCILGSIIVWPLVPHAVAWPAAFFMAVALGICRGINPVWFFQGTGVGMRNMAIWDVSSSILSLVLIFIFIHEPVEWERYLLITAACKGAAYLILNISLWRQYSLKVDMRAGFRILSNTSMLFASSFFMMLYNNGAQVVMGFFLGPAQMGVLVAVNKMLRALVSLVNPFTQTIFPEVCALRELKPGRTRFILRCSLLVTFALMAGAAAAIWLLAPWIIKIALGPEFVENAHILRIMILASPLMACNFVLGTQALVAFARERAQVKVQAAAAIGSLPLAAFLALHGLSWAAWLPLILEGSIMFGYAVEVMRQCPGAFFDVQRNI